MKPRRKSIVTVVVPRGVVDSLPAPVESNSRGGGTYDSLRVYLKSISEKPLLTPQEEIELADKIKAGDDHAREQMIKANLRLVVKIARDYDGFGLPLLDLINEGNIGLMKAVERFDPIKGAKLSTYAAWWIKQSIKRALSNQLKTIRLPAHTCQSIFRMNRATSAFESRHGRAPTDTELAAILNTTEEKIKFWKESASISALSLDTPSGVEGGDATLEDFITDENAVMPGEAILDKGSTSLIPEFIARLDEREQKILTERFGLDGSDPKTLEEIALEFGLTRERIRQIQNKVLKKLGNMFRKRDNVPQEDLRIRRTQKHQRVKTR